MLLFNVIVTEPLFVNEPQNPFLITVSVNMSLKMYSFYAKVKFLWELSADQENIFDCSTGGRSKLGLSGVWVGLYHGRDESQQEAGRESQSQRDSQEAIFEQGVKESERES